MNEKVYLLLGSNLGGRGENLATAIQRISVLRNVRILQASGVYNSPAMEMNEPAPDFLNQAVEIVTSLSPMQLLSELKQIEITMGRVDKGNYKSRIIDIDIVLFGDKIIRTRELTVPQERLLKRPFAMIPLVEIAPDILHPITKKLVSSYISETDFKLVTPVEEHAANAS
jgi:2-amino-4-hydroxy-6-hydroxymethyldihydropteridine diphosphokinase